MKARIAAALLAALGCAQMAADVGGLEMLKAVANATQASPAMKVFTSHEDYETFSPRFEIRYRATTGEQRVLPLTPRVYAGLEGPYNRRNAYGAALAYAPVLTAAPATAGIAEAVMHYGLCEPGPLVEELGLTGLDAQAPMTVVITPRRKTAPGRVLRFEVNCHD